MAAFSKFALVKVVLLSCGFFLAVAVLTKPLWAKEKPLYFLNSSYVVYCLAKRPECGVSSVQLSRCAQVSFG